jgi:hypothetical protein
MFGTLMFELLAGAKPYDGVSVSEAQRRILAGERPEPPAGALGSAEAWALVRECMAFDAARRPATEQLLPRLDALIAAAGGGSGPESAAGQPGHGHSQPAAPSVLDVLLTRPYAEHVNRKLASLSTWPSLGDLISGDVEDVRELVTVEGKAALKLVVSDLIQLVRQQTQGGRERARAIGARADVSLCACRVDAAAP